jgi:LmbE family N-acetylglucosaminyl deacetylase
LQYMKPLPSSIRVLALFAHPDDTEFLCAGTLAHLADRGASIHIASLTAGDCGSSILSSARISRLRRQEAQSSAALLHAEYTCLEECDFLVAYDRPTLRKVMELVRRVDPALVFAHSPQDYMVDHETASRLCQSACFGASAPNFRTGPRRSAPAVRTIPHLYYAQPYRNHDIMGDEVLPRLVVDISATLECKEKMLACHQSQRAWLQIQQAVRDIEDPLRQMAARAGELAGFPWGEGFRQHLGAAFPQENLLASLLAELVRPARKG